MLDDGGNLSVDFIAGMTIFMIALIWVANMVPGLLIGLQSRSIDLDAIAYRTGVILVEDPGMPATPSWDTLTDNEKNEIERFGLSSSKDIPNILKFNKVERFFCSTSFSYPADYQSRVIFGDRPYRFNISLKTFDALMIKSVGDIKPDGYGYIRRLVKIKYPSNTTIDAGLKNRQYNNTENVTTHIFNLDLNCTALIGGQTNVAYQINPRQERILVNITNLSGARVWHKDPILDNITIENIEIYRKYPASPTFGLVENYTDCREYPVTCKFFAYVDGASSYLPNVPVIVKDNISVMFSPGYFYGMSDDNSQIRIRYTFRLSHAPGGDNFFNNSFTLPYFYNYSPSQVTQPKLKEGALEVAIW
jgi:hypothetical protein